MDESQQGKIAFRLMNCHLKLSRKPEVLCDNNDISICTSELYGDLWNTYTLFFTHVQSTCYYLKSEIWQENTKILISDLEHTSNKVAFDLKLNLEQTSRIKES